MNKKDKLHLEHLRDFRKNYVVLISEVKFLNDYQRKMVIWLFDYLTRAMESDFGGPAMPSEKELCWELAHLEVPYSMIKRIMGFTNKCQGWYRKCAMDYELKKKVIK
jgi:hypothetical protein